MHYQLALAAALTGLSAAAPATIEKRFGDSYHWYKGDGSVGAGWPAKEAWGSWDQLWSANVPLMQQSCGWNGWGANDSAGEISNIKAAINQVATAQGLDNRVVLALVMQESKGCVRVPTTNNGVRNPGLLQSHNGSGTCAGVNPCPASEITQMIKDGAAGTASGDGYRQCHDKTVAVVGATSRSVYAAARMYNSGSVDYTNLDNGLGSTACYASDVANRLTGWTLAASTCSS